MIRQDRLARCKQTGCRHILAVNDLIRMSGPDSIHHSPAFALQLQLTVQ